MDNYPYQNVNGAKVDKSVRDKEKSLQYSSIGLEM